ncbi:MAG TPA: glycosyltransferase [Verrucomicrobiae bacterium]|nr:glycosyltransferase [Verrucomicrobiae bacterium]
MRALLFTVSIGAGHNKAAEAIAITLRQRGWVCEIVDTLQYINKAAHKIVVGTYLESVRFTPQLYGLLYRKAETGESLAEVSQLFNQLFSFKLQGLIEQFQPNIMICTHPFPLQMLSILKSKRRFKEPVMAILTDYVTHPFWVHRFIDAYVLPSDSLCFELAHYGIKSSKIFPLGIPVDPEFLRPVDKQAVYEQFGLDPTKPVILVMGGGLGFGSVEQVIKTLVSDPWDAQIVAVAGRNTKLQSHLEKLGKATDKKLTVLGYTNQVSSLMEISAVLVSKPGGLTVTEALIKRLPFAIISPIPGQEERNSDFLLNNGLAIRLRGNNLVPSLKQLLYSPLRLSQMRSMAEAIAKPLATGDIADLAYNLASKSMEKKLAYQEKNDV